MKRKYFKYLKCFMVFAVIFALLQNAALYAAVVPRTQLQATASSYHKGYEATKALDGKNSTIWNSEWSPKKPLPQSLTIKLGGVYFVDGMTYLPRQDSGTSGIVTKYNVYTSLDGKKYTLRSSGTWGSDHSQKTALFSPASASYVKFEATEATASLVAAAELSVIRLSLFDGQTYYRIVNKKSGKVLDVAKSSKNSNANIVQMPKSSSLSQQWLISDMGNGYYKIKNRNSGKMMGILSASTKNLANSVQSTSSSYNSQQWQIIDSGNGLYKIKNRNSAKLIGIKSSSTASGANSVQYSDINGLNQQWAIEKIVNVNDPWATRVSITTAATTTGFNQENFKGKTYTYRTIVKPRDYGDLNLSFWESNTIDSSWGGGGTTSRVVDPNTSGGSWKIEAAYVADAGTKIDGSIVTGTQVQVTFNGQASKEVAPDEKFWSDKVKLNIPEGHYLAFTWTITGVDSPNGFMVPTNADSSATSCFYALGTRANQEAKDGFWQGSIVAPSLFSYDKPVLKNIAFLGDSITQGSDTRKDNYEFWVSRISDGLGSRYGVWNVGSCWSRAYDAATDGAWLYKVKKADEVVICLGVNDIRTGHRTADQLVGDLTTIVSKIKQNNRNAKVILTTVPPFNLKPEEGLDYWRSVNATIRAKKIPGVDRVFDIAAVLSQPAPNDQLIKTEFACGNDDPHPNGTAASAIAGAFLSWY